MKIVKGLLIEFSKGAKVVEFDRDNYKELYPLIDCDLFEHAIRKVGNKVYDFWFDEEYLLKEEKFREFTACCVNYEEVIFGNLLITSNDGFGDIESLTEQDIENIKRNMPTILFDGEFTKILRYEV